MGEQWWPFTGAPAGRPARRPGRRPTAWALLAVATLLAGAGMAVAGLLARSPARPPAIAVPAGTGSATWRTAPATYAPGNRGTTAPRLPLAPPMPFSVPVLVAVPVIGVNARVIPLGENPDGTAQVPSLATPQLTSWFDDGPAPGQPGPAAIFGHVNTAAGPAAFSRVGALLPGDVVDVTRADGSVAMFQVYLVAAYDKGAFPTMTVYGDTPGPELRLITCGGAYDAATRSYQDNIVAYARLVR